jgi:hypothetical protein
MWDEAMFSKKDMLEHFVIPIITMLLAVLIIVSSPPASYNWCMAMLDAKNPITNESLFMVLKHKLVCDNCLANRKHPEKCPHNRHELPPWRASDSIEIARELYRTNQRMMMAEMMGVMMQSGGMEFPLEHIKMLQERPRRPWSLQMPNPEFVLFACDPNAGATDQTAIVAVTAVQGQFFVRASSSLSLVSVCLRRDARARRTSLKSQIALPLVTAKAASAAATMSSG